MKEEGGRRKWGVVVCVQSQERSWVILGVRVMGWHRGWRTLATAASLSKIKPMPAVKSNSMEPS